MGYIDLNGMELPIHQMQRETSKSNQWLSLHLPADDDSCKRSTDADCFVACEIS